MKAKKVLALVLCAALLVAGSVAATLAYLTSKTEVVTNTFTVGSLSITLDEAKVTEYGVAVPGENRVMANAYKLIPGHNYLKDPTVHVAKGSEECYVFVKVENGIAAIEAEDNTIAAQMAANGWKQLIVDGVAVTDVYYYGNDEGAIKVDARQAAVDRPVFASFTVATGADVSGYGNAAIKVTAYAAQADGLTVTAAWNAVK